MNATTRQRQLELTSVSRGVERYTKALDKEKEKGREFDTPVGQRVVSRMMERVVPAVRQLQKDARAKLVEAQTSGRRLGGWEMAVAASDATSLAYVAVRSILTHANERGASPKHLLVKRIGTIVNLEMRWSELRERERERAKEEPPNRLALLRRTVKQINPRSVRKWLRKLDDLPTTEWDTETKVKVGLVLLDLIVNECGEFVEIDTVQHTSAGRTKTVVYAVIRPEVKSAMEKENAAKAAACPWFLPMVCPPRPWAWDGEKYSGGYLTHDMGLLKETGQRHTAAVLHADSVPEACLSALHAIDRTAWKINVPVYEVALAAVGQQRGEVLPVAPLRPLPPEIDGETWARLTKEERGAAKRKRRMVHDHNNRLAAKREAMRRVLKVAEEFGDEEAIYFPHSMDFRGRAYPLPQDLHPQGDDFARGLLKFAHAKRLGDRGLRWLAYRAAATWGEDKIDRDGQVDWVVSHLDDIALVARDPLGEGYAFWCAAEEPWQFLAVAQELEAAFAHPEGPEEFASALPVFVDGSCNGLQHLSAMGLDPEGAHATNLTRDPERQDIYQIVADKVSGRVLRDCMKTRLLEPGWKPSDSPYNNWFDKVDRKVVKRGVMTVPYGLTDIGMRDQLIADRWTEGLDGDPVKNATYLRDLMKDAIADTVVKATEIMAWMQDNTHILAVNGRPVDWTAPSGFRVRQAYYNMTRKVITTLLGSTYIWKPGADQTLNVRKQVLSIVPNIIHSFDAAHMMLTIGSAWRSGFRDFAVVHDSFGCHACDMDDFLTIVREEFVNIYRQDWFGSLQAEFQAAVGPDVRLIPPPERGDFDIEEVRDAQFFFA